MRYRLIQRDYESHCACLSVYLWWRVNWIQFLQHSCTYPNRISMVHSYTTTSICIYILCSTSTPLIRPTYVIQLHAVDNQNWLLKPPYKTLEITHYPKPLIYEELQKPESLCDQWSTVVRTHLKERKKEKETWANKHIVRQVQNNLEV